jgi:hypothetical protein
MTVNECCVLWLPTASLVSTVEEETPTGSKESSSTHLAGGSLLLDVFGVFLRFDAGFFFFCCVMRLDLRLARECYLILLFFRCLSCSDCCSSCLCCGCSLLTSDFALRHRGVILRRNSISRLLLCRAVWYSIVG